MNRYEDIIHLPYSGTKTHKPMSMTDRGAQFSPFAALTGYDAAIQETGRLTDCQAELVEYSTSQLDEKLRFLWQQRDWQPQITVTYFQPDSRKEGGAYVSKTEAVRKIDPNSQLLLLQDETVIPFYRIYSLEGALFARMEALQLGLGQEEEIL